MSRRPHPDQDEAPKYRRQYDDEATHLRETLDYLVDSEADQDRRGDHEASRERALYTRLHRPGQVSGANLSVARRARNDITAMASIANRAARSILLRVTTWLI